MENISLEQFLEYETIRQSGVCNMYDSRTIMALSELTREDIKAIILNYDALADKYGTDIKETAIADIKEYYNLLTNGLA